MKLYYSTISIEKLNKMIFCNLGQLKLFLPWNFLQSLFAKHICITTQKTTFSNKWTQWLIPLQPQSKNGYSSRQSLNMTYLHLCTTIHLRGNIPVTPCQGEGGCMQGNLAGFRSGSWHQNRRRIHMISVIRPVHRSFPKGGTGGYDYLTRASWS